MRFLHTQPFALLCLLVVMAFALASCGHRYQPPGEDLWLTVNREK